MTGCAITALAVNSASAITTTRAVAAMVAGSRVRCAISMKKAMPSAGAEQHRRAEHVDELEREQ